MSLWTRALEPVPVRPVRIEKEGEEDDVEQALAPRRRGDGDVTVQTRLFRPVVVAFSDGLDLDHHARDVPGEGWQDRVSALAVGHACWLFRSFKHRRELFFERDAQGREKRGETFFYI